jgi:hypothetical protein
MKLTQAEIDKAETCQTSGDWRNFCDEVKAARDGEYPSDWWHEMKLSGRMDRIVGRWGANSELTVLEIDPFGKRKDL